MPRRSTQSEAFAHPPGRISIQHHNMRHLPTVVDALSGHPRGPRERVYAGSCKRPSENNPSRQ